jgi:RND family efflux transporter MFP subunit
MTDMTEKAVVEEPEAARAAEVTRAPARRGIGIYVAGTLIVALAAGASVTLSAKRKTAEAHEAAARAQGLAAGPVVAVAHVTEAPPGRTVTLSGEVKAYRQTTLYAKVSGYLKLVKVDKGERVKAGEVLGVIEAPEVEQQIVSQRATLALKKLTDARYQSLAKEGLIPKTEQDRAAAEVETASAELSRLAAMQGYQVIRAPFDGVVTARYADPGALLQAATSSQSALPLVEVADIDRVRVNVNLAQSEALFAREGDPVTVWAEEKPDAKVKGAITRMTKQLDPRTRTMLTEIELDNSAGTFYPGTFVRVSLSLTTPAALSVPADALTFRGGKPTVARVNEGRASFVPVEIRDSDGQSVRIQAGLAKGDTVVLHPGDDVDEGVAVQVLEKPAGKP